MKNKLPFLSAVNRTFTDCKALTVSVIDAEKYEHYIRFDVRFWLSKYIVSKLSSYAMTLAPKKLKHPLNLEVL
jgi:hypothetical protein